MSVKISIFKSSADGEQTNCEYSLEKRDFDRMMPHVLAGEKGEPNKIVPGESLREILDPYFRLMDDRLREMNIRIMCANKMVRGLPPESQMAFHAVQDVLHGMKPQSMEWSDLMRESIREVQESLVKQGIPRNLIEESLRNSFGPEFVAGPEVPQTPSPIESNVQPIVKPVVEPSKDAPSE